jgi:hypothetical protein
MALGDGSFAGFGLGSTSQRPLLLSTVGNGSVVGLNSEVKRSTGPATDATRPWGLLLMQWRSEDSPKERGSGLVGTAVTVDLGATYTVLTVSAAFLWSSYVLFR